MDLMGVGVLITGAGKGLGRATAIKLAGSGARLALAARSEEDLRTLAEEIRGLGGEAHPFPVDVGDVESVTKLAKDAEAACGPIGVLINSAGLGRYNPLELLTPGEIHEMVDTNLKGTIFTTQAIYQRMRPRARGLIINVLSTAGREGKAKETAYCASKWGVMGFSKALALEARKYGIRVTAFCPGGMDTPFWDHEPSERQPNRERFLDPKTAAEGILQILSLPENVEVPEYAVRGVG
ncbi:MAG: SDR family oxidoreductase [Candidatus Omnitrophica bacterium]|nr:SDR family oxidoreductase [Candidatus Omnitrophota bacterium]